MGVLDVVFADRPEGGILPTPAEATALSAPIARILQKNFPVVRIPRHGPYLVRYGARRFAFFLRSMNRRGVVRLTGFYKVRSLAVRSLYRDWPSLFHDWMAQGEREGTPRRILGSRKGSRR